MNETVAEPAGASLLERVRVTFLAPARLAETIAPAFPWLDALVVTTAVALFGVATMPNDVFVEPMRDAVSRRGSPVEIVSPPEVIAQWGRAMGMLSTLATHPIIAVVLAGLLLVLFGYLLRSSAAFRELLSLSTHALLIPALGTLIAGMVRLATGSAEGPGSGTWLQPAADASFLTHVLFAIDPFIVWMLVVIAIGIHGLDPRQSQLRGSAILVAGYVALVLASSAILHPELRRDAAAAEPLPRARLHPLSHPVPSAAAFWTGAW